MSKRLIQDLHAAISRRGWWAVETAANRLRDEVEKAIDILAGTGKGSLPNDYPLSELAANAVSPKPDPSALLLEAASALEPFAMVPESGIHGGPLVVAKVLYEDGTDENSARHKGTITSDEFRAARSTLSKIRGGE